MGTVNTICKYCEIKSNIYKKIGFICKEKNYKCCPYYKAKSENEKLRDQLQCCINNNSDFSRGKNYVKSIKK